MSTIAEELSRIKEEPSSFLLTWAAWLETVSPKAREEITEAVNKIDAEKARLVAALEHSMDTSRQLNSNSEDNDKLFDQRESQLIAILRGEKP